MAVIRRKPIICIDSRWTVKWKWLWDAFAGPNEGYAGYITAWDSIPWQKVKFDDGVVRDFNNAAQAQYMPSYDDSGTYYHLDDPCIASGMLESYCHSCLGLVGDVIEILEDDHIADMTIEAAYTSEGSSVITDAPLRNLFFRNFNPANRCCPIVFSRPMTYTFGAPGHIADNNSQFFFAFANHSCDGTAGLRGSLSGSYRREFRADAIWFFRNFSNMPSVPADARLIVYIIACGSVPRIRINGTWHIVSPDYFPPYGDPYGYVFRGHKAVIRHHGLLGSGFNNEIIVEHIAPHGNEVGAQVIFSMEWKTK